MTDKSLDDFLTKWIELFDPTINYSISFGDLFRKIDNFTSHFKSNEKSHQVFFYKDGIALQENGICLNSNHFSCIDSILSSITNNMYSLEESTIITPYDSSKGDHNEWEEIKYAIKVQSHIIMIFSYILPNNTLYLIKNLEQYSIIDQSNSIVKCLSLKYLSKIR